MFIFDVRIEANLLLYCLLRLNFAMRISYAEFPILKSLRTVLTVLTLGSQNALVQNVTIHLRTRLGFPNFALPQRELLRGSGQESCKRCSGSVTG